MYAACPECRVIYGRENGYFTGAMLVSYALGVPLLGLLYVPLLGLLYVPIALISGWTVEWVLLAAGLYFLAFVPALFRYSRVIWMHFDRVVDADPESERYAPPRRLKTTEVVPSDNAGP